LLFFVPLVVAIAIIGYVTSLPAEPVSVRVGQMAPDFELEVVGPDGLTGQKVKLSSLRGKVVFLEFMESWCHACQGVAPAIESLREDYESKGVFFLSVAGTHQGADAQSTAAFIREYRTQWTYVLDSNNDVFSRYNVQATPTFFIIDSKGEVVSRFQGVVTTQALSSALDAALSG